MPVVAQTSLLIALGLVFLILFVLRLRRHAGVRIPLGLTSMALFSAAYFLPSNIQPLFDKYSIINETQLSHGIGTLFWLAFAYTINVCIKRFVYRRRLTLEGDPTVPLIIQYLVTVIIYMVTAMIIVKLVYGQPIFGIAATSGALAIVLGYSARTVLEEVFAGIALNFSNPFEKGDLIQLNDEWASVKDIGWRSITYLDMDNNYVVVPNSVVAKSKIRNLDRPNSITRRLYYFLIEYNVPPKVVIDIAKDTMKECPHIMDHEWNDACLFDFDDTGIRYRAAFHIRHSDEWWSASNEYFNALWYAFNRAGIRFGQQRYLNFAKEEDADRSLPSSPLEDSNWQTLVDQFDQTPMFESMTSEDMAELARSATLHVVGPPERIIRAGSKRTSMYLIASGKADVYALDENGKETWMAEVGEGETVGLMSLLTGVPQKTTIRARTETAVWEISSESLHDLFDKKPEVMDRLAADITKWQAEEDDALSAIQLSAEQEEQMLEKNASSLRNRISRFFDHDKKDDSNDGYTGF